MSDAETFHDPQWWAVDNDMVDSEFAPFQGQAFNEMDNETIARLLGVMATQFIRLRVIVQTLALEEPRVPPKRIYRPRASQEPSEIRPENGKRGRGRPRKTELVNGHIETPIEESALEPVVETEVEDS